MKTNICFLLHQLQLFLQGANLHLFVPRPPKIISAGRKAESENFSRYTGVVKTPGNI